MLTEQTDENAHHLVRLIKAALWDAGPRTRILSGKEPDGPAEHFAKVKRLEAIINLADDIRKQAKAELDTWEGIDNILSGKGYE